MTWADKDRADQAGQIICKPRSSLKIYPGRYQTDFQDPAKERRELWYSQMLRRLERKMYVVVPSASRNSVN
jgi:hypothetical protein